MASLIWSSVKGNVSRSTLVTVMMWGLLESLSLLVVVPAPFAAGLPALTLVIFEGGSQVSPSWAARNVSSPWALERAPFDALVAEVLQGGCAAGYYVEPPSAELTPAL